MDFGNVPVLVILQNEYKVRDSVKEPEQKMPGGYNADFLAATEYATAVERIKKNLPLPVGGRFVHIKDGMPSWTIRCPHRTLYS